MLRHCRKEWPLWPWLGVALLAVLWVLWGLWGWGWVMVQVPTVVMQDLSDTGPVRGSRPRHWMPSQCQDRSPALQPPAVVRVVASLSHREDTNPGPAQHSPDPTCVGNNHHAGHWVGCPDVRPVASPLLGLPSCCACLGFLQPPGTAQHGTAWHSTMSPLPHVCPPRHWAPRGTGQPVALGTVWHWARCAGHWLRCAVSTQHQAQTRVWHLAQPHTHGHRRVPGAASRGTAGAPCLATLPRHGPASPVQPGFFRQRQICTTLVPIVMLPQCPL